MLAEEYAALGKQLMDNLVLRFSPIALKLLFDESEIPEGSLRPFDDRGDRLAMCQAYAMVSVSRLQRRRKATTPTIQRFRTLMWMRSWPPPRISATYR